METNRMKRQVLMIMAFMLMLHVLEADVSQPHPPSSMLHRAFTYDTKGYEECFEGHSKNKEGSLLNTCILRCILSNAINPEHH